MLRISWIVRVGERRVLIKAKQRKKDTLISCILHHRWSPKIIIEGRVNKNNTQEWQKNGFTIQYLYQVKETAHE